MSGFYRNTLLSGRIVVSDKIEPDAVGATPLVGRTWLEARENVDMYGLIYVSGHGWFYQRYLP